MAEYLDLKVCFSSKSLEEVDVMSVEKKCANCANAKPRKGELYCALLKQKVSPDYKCGKFKPKGG